jgi:hypothetical protein
MSELHRFDPTSDEDVRREFDAFEERCDEILSVVFKCGKPAIVKFHRWLEGVVPDRDSRAHFVHNDPFEISADFMGVSPDSSKYAVRQRQFHTLARKLRWDRSPRSNNPP